MDKKLKTKTVKLIEYLDWNNFVTDIYRKPYNFQQQFGVDRGTEKFSVPYPYEDEFDFENTSIPFEVNGNNYGVSFETWLNTSPEDTLKHFDGEFSNRLFWVRNFYPDVSMIIMDLHSKGLLEEGEYVIDVDW